MQKEKNVKNLVTPLENYPQLPYWATLKESLIQLKSALEDGINTILVFDEAYKLVGILIPSGILKGLEPPSKRRFKERAEFWSNLLAGNADEQLMATIKNIMSPAAVTINADDSFFKALHIMLSENQSVLAVQEQDKIIGVIKLEDVFREIIETLLAR